MFYFRKFLKKICICLSAFIFFYSFLFVISLISSVGPQELREPSIVLNTNLLVLGKNPYSLVNMPIYVNVYGIFYHLILFPFAKIFSSTLLLHRIASFIFLIASVFYFYYLLKREKIPTYLAIIACSLLYVQIVVWGYDLLARPDSLGFLLFLLSIFVPRQLGYSLKGLVLGLLLSLLGFMTKPYFIIGIPLLSIYLFLFVSKLKGVLFGICSLLAVFITLFLLNYFFETYILNTIFIHKALAGNDYNRLILQIQAFAIWNSPLIIMLALLAKQIPHKISINLKQLRAPLILQTIDFPSFCAVTGAFLIYLKLGLHNGNFMTYFNHLFTPFFIFLIFKNLKNINKKIIPIIEVLLFVNLCLWTYLEINKLPNLYPTNNSWEEWRKLLGPYKNVYNSSPLSLILMDQGKPIYDTGQSEFFIYSLPDNDNFNLVRGANRIQKNYTEKIREQISDKKFDLVVITKYGSPFFSMDLLKKTYYLGGTKLMNMYKTSHEALLWYPKSR